MIELKQCPFCGWKAILHTHHHGNIYIGCANDNCFTHIHKFETEKEAIKAWNKRA